MDPTTIATMSSLIVNPEGSASAACVLRHDRLCQMDNGPTSFPGIYDEHINLCQSAMHRHAAFDPKPARRTDGIPFPGFLHFRQSELHLRQIQRLMDFVRTVVHDQTPDRGQERDEHSGEERERDECFCERIAGLITDEPACCLLSSTGKRSPPRDT
ncbi:MAG: hypothetical protein IPI01_00315 [Ignavibacteriae bacterium]|nr:hypothetical protein [Ignavibacteriota bacterium]